jgi:hypothetical protein
MSEHWIALIDLSTSREIVSDLVLHAKVLPGDSVRFVVQSLHVP